MSRKQNNCSNIIGRILINLMSFKIPLTKSGYIDVNKLPTNKTLDQIERAITKETKNLIEIINVKEKELLELKTQLSRWGYEYRTIWLLFDENGLKK